MAFGIRLRLDPVLDGSSGGLRVVGLRPGFTLLGKGVSNAAVDKRVPAKLELVGRLISTVREPLPPKEIQLPVLTGQLELGGRPLSVFFVCDPASLQALTEAPPPPPLTVSDGLTFRPRSLKLELGPSFQGVGDLSPGAVPQVFLPEEAKDFNFLEVFVRLTINASIEAELEVGDVLDVRIQREPLLPYPFSV